jgi:ketosteroid isomerase-like protein
MNTLLANRSIAVFEVIVRKWRGVRKRRLEAFHRVPVPGNYTSDMIHEPEVREFLAEYEAASASKDFTVVAPMIHPKALFRFTEGDFRGHAEIQGAFAKTWAFDVHDDRYFLTDVEVVTEDDASATVTYTWNWTGEAKGEAFTYTGRGTSVIVQEDGRLLIVLEHLSK